MANSILDILIRTITSGEKKPSEVAKSLINLKQHVGAATGAFAAFAGATYAVDKVLDATVGELVSYANEVRRVQGATGQSAEESSKLIQVLDDQKISYEQLEKAIAKSGTAYDFSIEGLANMSDEYLQLTSAQEQASFMQERFGKQWISFVPVMQQGGQAIRDAADGLSENLILTQESVDAARQYEVANDNLSDSFLGLKMSIGKELLPAVNEVLDGMQVYIRAIEIAKEKNDGGIVSQNEWRAALEEATVEISNQKFALTQHDEALQKDGESTEELLARQEALMASNKELLDTTFNLQEGYDRFSEKNLELVAAQDELMAQKEVLLQDLEELRSQGFWETGKTITKVKDDIAELDEKLAENGEEFDKNAKAAEEWSKKLVFSMIQARLAASGGGIDADEFAFLIGLGENMGLIDDKTADMAQNLNDALNDIDLSKPQDFEQLWRDILELPREATFTITTNTSGSPTEPSHPGGGGFATGGAFDAGSPMLVHKDEILVPDYGGVVLTRTDAMKLMQGNGGNGGGKTFINYGSMSFIVQGSVMDVLDELS